MTRIRDYCVGRTRQAWRRSAAVLAVLALGSTLAACGGEDAGGEKAAVSQSTLDKARALVEKYQELPTTVGTTEKLPVAPSSFGPKSVIFMQNPTPTSQVIAAEVKEATELLGWRFKVIAYEATAEGIQGAFEQAIAEKPDVILDSATAADTIVAMRTRMAEEGIDFIACCTSYSTDVKAPPLGNLSGGNTLAFNGQLLADWMITQTDGQVNALVVTVPTFTVLAEVIERQEARFEELCPDSCETKVINAQVTDIGTNVPGMVVSALQRDPSINYVSLAFAGLAAGLPEALAQAGLEDQVKIVSQNPKADNLQDLTDGKSEMMIATADAIVAWRMVDTYLQHLAGAEFPMEATDATDTGPTALNVPVIVTADNGPFGEAFTEPSNYKDIFKELWGL